MNTNTTSTAPQFVSGLPALCLPSEINRSDTSCEGLFDGYLPDKRLCLRGAELVEAIICNCSAVLNQIVKDEAQAQAFCRFLKNERADTPSLIQAVTDSGGAKAAGRHVLSIQDSSEANFRTHSNRIDMESFGPVGNNSGPGIMLHPTLLVDAESGVPLGLGALVLWKRAWDKGNKHSRNYNNLPIEEKESYRWELSSNKVKETCKDASMITHIADREADIYELFSRIPDEKNHLLIRCRTDRYLKNGSKVSDLLGSLEPMGEFSLEVKVSWKKGRKQKKRSRHTATMQVKYTPLTLQKPKHLKSDDPDNVEIYMVEVRETPESVLPGEEPVHWRIYTTHKVENLEDALQIIRWYKLRWQIEQLFRTLKSQGLQIESSQLEKGDSISKLAVMALQASVKIMQLNQAWTPNPKEEATVVFSKEEIAYLWLIKEKYEGKTKNYQNPFPSESLPWASWIIGRLGGWVGNNKRPKPGPITLKRGLAKFEIMIEAWRILHDGKDVIGD